MLIPGSFNLISRRHLLYAAPRGFLATAAGLASIGVGCAHAEPAAAIGQDVLEATVDAYRALHAYPEVGKQEHFASTYLTRRLSALSGVTLSHINGLPTAVAAVLQGGRPGPTIALRAELDARPLEAGVVEPAHHDPRSTIDGIMHNCGHDAHAAMLLGSAVHLSRVRAGLTGRIVFLFQPAEEIAGGAEDVLADGILDRLGVEAIFAQHCVPGMPVGDIQLSRGTFLAGSTYFTLTLKGAASHAAAPQDASDLPLLAARMMSELATFPARRLDMLNQPVVISTTQMSTNAQTLNGLPSEVVLAGTIRALGDIQQPAVGGRSIADLLQAHVRAMAEAVGASASLLLATGSPPTHNDEALFDALLPVLQDDLGPRLSASGYRGMFSEDFAFYTGRYPALYFSLGILKDGLGGAGVHRPDFTLHPDALAVGTELLVSIARHASGAITGMRSRTDQHNQLTR